MNNFVPIHNTEATVSELLVTKTRLKLVLIQTDSFSYQLTVD